MTPQETNLLATVQTCLQNRNKALKLQGKPEDWTFTSDLLRALQVDKYLKRDSEERLNVGSVIVKWHHFGFCERTGRSRCSEVRSNHGHRIEVWVMKQP